MFHPINLVPRPLLKRLRHIKKGRKHTIIYPYTMDPTKTSPFSHYPPQRKIYYRCSNPLRWISKAWSHTHLSLHWTGSLLTPFNLIPKCSSFSCIMLVSFAHKCLIQQRSLNKVRLFLTLFNVNEILDLFKRGRIHLGIPLFPNYLI